MSESVFFQHAAKGRRAGLLLMMRFGAMVAVGTSALGIAAPPEQMGGALVCGGGSY